MNIKDQAIRVKENSLPRMRSFVRISTDDLTACSPLNRRGKSCKFWARCIKKRDLKVHDSVDLEEEQNPCASLRNLHQVIEHWDSTRNIKLSETRKVQRRWVGRVVWA